MRLSSSTQASLLSGRFESTTVGSSHFSEKENSLSLPSRIMQKSSAVQRAKAQSKQSCANLKKSKSVF